MLPVISTAPPARRESGAIIITFSLMLLFLIGFAAIAIDLGRLFVVRTELQTALDSCALAGAQELDGGNTAIARAKMAGVTAGNLNNVNLQSATWAGQPKLVVDEVTFKDGNYNATTVDANARYVQCQHTASGVQAWLLPAMAKFSGTPYSSTNSVLGTAVATRTSAQTSCPIPLSLKPQFITPPDYGLTKGDWVTLVSQQAVLPGQIGWQVLDPNGNGQSGSVLAGEWAEPGYCGTKVGDNLPDPYQGRTASVDEIWDSRFGVYKNNSKFFPPAAHPDFTGYEYTTHPPGGVFADFLNKRAAFQPYQFPNNSDFKIFLNTLQYAQYGYNKRVVTVPILNGNTVVDFACMLMLATRPLTGPNTDSQLEYLGNASAPNSPCTTNGLAGGSAGPLVPVLVR